MFHTASFHFHVWNPSQTQEKKKYTYSSNVDIDVLASEWILKKDSDVLANSTRTVETLGPLLQDTTVDSCLKDREREGVTQMKSFVTLSAILGQETVNAISDEITKMTHRTGLQFLRDDILLLADSVFTTTQQVDLANTQVGSTQIKSHKVTLFLTSTTASNKGRNHGN